MSMLVPLRTLIVPDVDANSNSGAAGTEFQTVKDLEAIEALGHSVDVICRQGLSHFIKHREPEFL